MRNLILAVFFTLLGCAFAGCDGGTNDQPDVTVPDAGTAPDAIRIDSQSPKTDVRPAMDTGLFVNEVSGWIACPVPSPTGDESQKFHFVVVTNDPRTSCEAAKAANTKVLNDAKGQLLSPPVSTSGLDCSDVAHDFSGSTGVAWCVGVTANDGLSGCDGGPTGTPTCLAGGIAVMGKNAKGTFIRSFGICSPSGVFLGWACTVS